MNSPKAIIHVGLHKTGTTYLQQVFTARDAWLHDRGILFPQTGLRRPKNASSALASHGHGGLMPLLKVPMSDKARALREALKAEQEAAGVERLMFSSELFAAPMHTARCAKGFRSYLGVSADVTVIAYVRRQDWWLESFYREILGWSRQRITESLPAFFEADGKTWLDFEARLKPWVKTFGEDNVIVRSYDDAMHDGGLLSDFLSALGIDDVPPDLPADTGRPVNPSLDPSFTDLVRGLNAVATLTDEQKTFAIRTLLESEPPIDALKGTLIDDAFWTTLADTYRTANANFAERYMSGPSEGFLFGDARPPCPPATQRIGYETARSLFGAASGGTAARFGIVTTVNESQRQTEEFIAYHLAQGAHHMVVFFDNEDDPAAATFANDARVTAIRCTDAYWQRTLGRMPENMPVKQHTNLEHGSALLRKAGVDWIICIDADELLHAPGRSISRVLGSFSPGIAIVQVRPLEAIQHDGMAVGRAFKSAYFKKLPPEDGSVKKKDMNRIYSGTNALTKSGFFGHVAGKAFFRADAEIDDYKQHMPGYSGDGDIIETYDDLRLLHFDCISFESWSNKWHRRIFGATKAVNIGDKRKTQTDRIRAAFENGEQAVEELFTAWNYLPPRRLRDAEKLGLVERIDFAPEAFVVRRGDGDAAPAPGSFGVVTTIDDTLDTAEAFANYHLNLGASHVVVFCTDPDSDLPARFGDRADVTCVPCTRSHWMEQLGRAPRSAREKLLVNDRLGQQILRDHRVEWTVPLRPDQLLHAQWPAVRNLRQVPSDVAVVRFASLEAICEADIDAKPFAQRCFKTKAAETAPPASVRQRLMRHLIGWETRAVPDMEALRVAADGYMIRNTEDIGQVRENVSDGIISSGTTILRDNFHVLEFGTGSFELWRAMWTRLLDQSAGAKDGSPLPPELRTAVATALDSADRGKALRLFRRSHCWPAHRVRLALRAGLLRRLDLADTLFETPRTVSATEAETGLADAAEFAFEP